MIDGINPQYLADLKKTYGSIFLVEDMGVKFLCRPMSKRDIDELSEFQKHRSSAEAEDEMLRRCVVHPKRYDFGPHSAAFVSGLSEEITYRSGFSDEERFLEMLEEARVNASRVNSVMKAIIIAAQPSYKPEDIDDLTLLKSLELLALSEVILTMHRAEDPRLELVGEEPAPKGQRRGGGNSAQGQDPIAAMLQDGMKRAAAETGLNPANLEKY